MGLETSISWGGVVSVVILLSHGPRLHGELIVTPISLPTYLERTLELLFLLSPRLSLLLALPMRLTTKNAPTRPELFTVGYLQKRLSLNSVRKWAVPVGGGSLYLLVPLITGNSHYH
eukprot:jgi/Botrbrau1/12819/Bobra.20_1s0010.1